MSNPNWIGAIKKGVKGKQGPRETLLMIELRLFGQK